MKNLEILHICVNYRNNQETKAFIENCLLLQGADKVQFIVCDNSYRLDLVKDSVFTDWQLPNQVLLLRFPDNPGYLGAAHRALMAVANAAGQAKAGEKYLGHKFRFIILSNTDLQISSQDFYQRLLAQTSLTLGEDNKIGVLAPSIRSLLTNKEGNPLYQLRPSASKMKFLVKVYSFYPLAFLYHLLSLVKSLIQGFRQQPGSHEIYAAHGAFMIFTANFFNSGGTFNYPSKLYGEELFLAEQLRRFGLSTRMLDELKIIHREKGTELSLWHRIGLSRKTFEFKRDSSKVISQNWR